MSQQPTSKPLSTKTKVLIFVGCWAGALLIFVCFVWNLSTLQIAAPDPATTPIPVPNNGTPSTSSTPLWLLQLLVNGGIFLCLMGFIAGPLVLLMLQNRGIKYNIPENHLAVLFVHGRKQLVVQGQSFNVRPEQGQTLQFFNLREQTKPFPHTCDTADQIRVNLEVELRWLHMPATMFLYLDSTDDPPSAIAAAVKAELTTQISRCDYALAMKNLKIIAMRTTTAASIKAVQYGLQVNSVYIKSVKIDAASSAAREEASRINALNDAVNKASDKTLDFVLKTRDDKTKDDTKKD